MKNQKVAYILIGCAVLFAIGAYLLTTGEVPAPSTKSQPDEVRQAVSPPEQKTEAPEWVDKGQEAKPDYSAADKNPEPKPEAKPTPPVVVEEQTTESNVIEVKEDSVITFTFAESLADYMLNRFQPQDMNGKPTTLVSAKSLNMAYGRDMTGFNVKSDDIMSARKAVLGYAFNPTMIKTLTAAYTPVLMTHLVDTATNDDRDYKVGSAIERRTLDDMEIAAMLRLNSQRMEQAAKTFRAIGKDKSISTLSGQYIQAAKAVERSNERLQIAISEEKDTSEASQRLKQAIMQREQIKNTITAKLKKACSECSEADLFYIAQWSYRRVLGDSGKKLKTFTAAADALDQLAKEFRLTSADLERQ